MQVWIGNEEAPAARFGLSLRGLDAKRLGKPKALLRALLASAVLSDPEPWVRRPQQGKGEPIGLIGQVSGREGSLLFSRSGEAATIDVSAWGDPAPVVRTVEAFLLRLQPSQVRLEVPARAAGEWSEYPSEGALFVRWIEQRKSEFQEIGVGAHPVYGRMLFLNGETQIATTDERDYSAALVDAGWTKRTRRVCILGGGDCGVLREVLARRNLEEALMIEIDREVVATAARHFPEVVGESATDPRAAIVYADALAHLDSLGAEIAQGSRPPFDLVISDLSDAPLQVESQDALCERVKAVLGPKGRIAVQCGSALRASRKQLKAHRLGLERHFRKPVYTERVIPSFLEQPWVFASARLPKA
ncbi:MAG: hypothetical protein JKY65_18130 [Planctomycetes bacterium]|nr:hypothetical protein [Planctomycetota bacterium]